VDDQAAQFGHVEDLGAEDVPVEGDRLAASGIARKGVRLVKPCGTPLVVC
jgi:hypothetical protein